MASRERPTAMSMRRSLLAALTLLLALAGCGESGEENLVSSHELAPTQAATASTSPGPTSTPASTSPKPSSSAPIAASSAPRGSSTNPAGRARLEILAPKDGQTISLPAAIRYRVTGTVVPRGARLRVLTLDLAPFEIPVSEQSGTVVLPDEKSAYLPGRRDLTFQLVAPNGRLLAGPDTVRDLTIEGRRGTY